MRLHNRQVKATFWTDTELIAHLDPIGRQFYQGLWHLADDSGCVFDDPVAFKIHLYPGDASITPDTLRGYRDTLIEIGKLVPYVVAGRSCLFLVNFHRHQAISRPAGPSSTSVPLPPWVQWRVGETRSESRYVVSDMSLTCQCHDTAPVGVMTPPEPKPEPEPEPEEDTHSATDVAGLGDEPENPQTAPVQPPDIAEIWNELCGDVLPRVVKLTDGRRKKLRARMAEDGARRSPDWWREYFAQIRASPFCCGDGPRSWRADLDWAIRSEDVVTRVLEGNYRRGGGPSHGPGGPHQRPGESFRRFSQPGGDEDNVP